MICHPHIYNSLKIIHKTQILKSFIDRIQLLKFVLSGTLRVVGLTAIETKRSRFPFIHSTAPFPTIQWH